MRRWKVYPSGTTSPARATAACAAALAIVLVGIVSGASTWQAGVPVVSASVLHSTSDGTSRSVGLRLTAGAAAVEVHVGLVPGTSISRSPIEFFADPTYPSPYATFTQVHEVAERVSLQVPSVGFVDGSGLPKFLNSNAQGALVVLAGVLPDEVLSNTSGELSQWVHAGGLLVWAGGPLGYLEGHPVAGGPFAWRPMGWAGQLALAGFPLTDAGPLGPMLADRPNPLGDAFGMTYNGTPAGANVSALTAHSGVPIGEESVSSGNGGADRVAIAYIPEGLGGVLFFGGSFSMGTRPQVTIPSADFGLSNDLILELGSGWTPSGGPSTFLEITLAAHETRDLDLTVGAPGGPVPVLAIAQVPAIPAPLAHWSVPL